jgi:peptidoglycan/xylan/chitin deacetylase (PgdA/CDA1 family)
MRLPSGIFTLSLDFELIWGTRDLFGKEGFRRAVEIERAVVVDRLLTLLDRYQVSASWCTVGHLFLDHCSCDDGKKHPSLVPATHAWYPDWLADDPCTNEASDPLYYGRSLIEKVRACRTPQEIGSHSFSHVIFDDPGCSSQTARSELEECVRVAQEMGIALRSFVFPRNQVAHLDVLRDCGFTVYRGIEPRWYNDGETVPERIRRMAHLADVLLASEPPVVLPERAPSGLWNVPGSMMYFPSNGLRRLIPVERRVKRALRGIDAAARTTRIFHLWFHPTNLADNTDKMFDGLEEIFAHARRLADDGQLRIMPMGDIAALCEGTAN